eukprot:5176408-Prymnesium_polylepis.1
MTLPVDNQTTERRHCNRNIRRSQETNSVTLYETQFGHPDAFCASEVGCCAVTAQRTTVVFTPRERFARAST